MPALILGRSAQKSGLSTQETAAYQKREIGKALLVLERFAAEMQDKRHTVPLREVRRTVGR